jgi:hypothetical protein
VSVRSMTATASVCLRAIAFRPPVVARRSCDVPPFGAGRWSTSPAGGPADGAGSWAACGRLRPISASVHDTPLRWRSQGQTTRCSGPICHRTATCCEARVGALSPFRALGEWRCPRSAGRLCTLAGVVVHGRVSVINRTGVRYCGRSRGGWPDGHRQNVGREFAALGARFGSFPRTEMRQTVAPRVVRSRPAFRAWECGPLA